MGLHWNHKTMVVWFSEDMSVYGSRQMGSSCRGYRCVIPFTCHHFLLLIDTHPDTHLAQTYTQFIHAHGFDKNIIEVFGNQNQLIDLNFNGCSAQKYINIRAGSQYNTIERVNFQDKPTSSDIGNLIEIQADKKIPGYNTIRYCSFQQMPGKGGDNGNEPIRIGEGTSWFHLHTLTRIHSPSHPCTPYHLPPHVSSIHVLPCPSLVGKGAMESFISRTVVEFNVFNNTGLADSETISVKGKVATSWSTHKPAYDVLLTLACPTLLYPYSTPLLSYHNRILSMHNPTLILS